MSLKVNLLLTHHKLAAGNPVTVQNEKNIIFLMDDVKDEPDEDEKPKKKKRKSKSKKETKSKGKDVTFKNFGASLNVSMFKQGSKLSLGWRCRLGLGSC